MVVPTSFLNPGTVSTIHDLQRRGFATQQALRGVSITLWRGETALPPVTVVVTYADRGQIDTARSGIGAIAPSDSGTFEGPEDWDVKEWDIFLLGGARGQITDVAPLPVNGSLTAVFRLDDRGVGNGQ